ncbi:MAG: M23 family metallopeptidase [Chloroflexi bacterium]|nr:M23 family metallopeptidase [Chloroflexota bacterium]
MDRQDTAVAVNRWHVVARLAVWGGMALLLGCQTASPTAVPLPTTQPTAVLPTATVTAVLPTATIKPTATQPPPPTVTPAPTRTQPPPPSRTPSPTATLAPTATRPSPLAVGRTCPAEYPVKPEYQRLYLAAQPWPTPDPALLDAHFWLAKPLPGGGRFLINNNFPYGSDGSGRYLLHNGVDSAEDKGTPVLAAADGLVVYAGPDADILFGWRCDWYGHLVVIQHDFTWLDQPVYTLYGHVLGIVVETGQRVYQGQPVAEIGVGGAATHAHLHFEVRIGENAFGATRNPMLWLDPGGTRGVLAGRLVDENGRPWQGVTITLIDGRGEEVQFLHTWSYLDDPDHLINPDEGYAENFVFADLLPGFYELFVKVREVEYRQRVEISAGALRLVEMQIPGDS